MTAKTVIYTAIFVGVLSLSIIVSNFSREVLTVENNIERVPEGRLLSMAAEMHAPEWNDILLEIAEWGAVAGVSLATYGAMAKGAVALKMARNANKSYKIGKATKESYTLLNTVLKPFYKSLARPFNKSTIKLVPNVTGIYVFFKKRTGKVKYVGKAVDLRLRLGQHLRGPSNSGNLYLSQNAKSLAFIAIPIKAIGNNKDAIKCVEAIGIAAFNDGTLVNKRIEKINKNDCKQLIKI